MDAINFRGNPIAKARAPIFVLLAYMLRKKPVEDRKINMGWRALPGCYLIDDFADKLKLTK